MYGIKTKTVLIYYFKNQNHRFVIKAKNFPMLGGYPIGLVITNGFVFSS
jgi:hypothetical protein